MRSIPLALSWELLRHGTWRLILASLAAMCIPMLLFFALQQEGGIVHTDPSLIIMHILFIQVGAFSIGLVAVDAQGSPTRLATYPVRTATLVAWYMLPAMALVFAHTLFMILLLNGLFSLDWPLWGPALSMVVMMAAVQAALWLCEGSSWLPMAVASAGVAIGLWIKSRYGPAFSLPNHYWRTVQPVEVAAMLVMVLAAYAIAVIAVARNRCGEPPGSLGILQWLGQRLTRGPYAGPAFRTAEQAQRWSEWREKGWIMPAASAFLLIAYLAGWSILSRDPRELFQAATGGGVVLSITGLICGFVLGRQGTSDARAEFGSFLATRPMATSEMARVVLKVAAQSVVGSWCLGLLGFGAVYLGVYLVSGPRELHMAADFELWWCLEASLLGPWIVTASTMTLALAGRPALFGKIAAAAAVTFISTLFAGKWVLSDDAQAWLLRTLVVAFGVGAFIGTGWMFWFARRRSLIGSATLAAAVTAGLALVILLSVSQIGQVPERWLVSLIILGAVCLAIVPLAAAPLALQWNRHR